MTVDLQADILSSDFQHCTYLSKKGEKTTANTNAYQIFHGKLRKKHLADLEVHGKIILKRTLREIVGEVCQVKG